MAGYKLCLADILLYYGLHRYLVRTHYTSFHVIAIIMCLFVHRLPLPSSKKWSTFICADGLIR